MGIGAIIVVIILIGGIITSALMAMGVWSKSEGDPSNTFIDNYGSSDIQIKQD
jgi:hypothetical protein